MFYSNMSYDTRGRKRRKSKPKGEVYKKYTAPKFTELKSENIPTYSRAADHREKYPSLDESSIAAGNACGRKERLQYTGTLVKGIATMHKSNAVPIIDEQQAKDISSMRR